jgi:hypothetical protein
MMMNNIKVKIMALFGCQTETITSKRVGDLTTISDKQNAKKNGCQYTPKSPAMAKDR